MLCEHRRPPGAPRGSLRSIWRVSASTVCCVASHLTGDNCMWFRPLLLVVLSAGVAGAQSAPVAAGALSVSVSGFVRDSVSGGPLAGAMIQLVSVNDGPGITRTAVSDSLGRFALGDVPGGRFILGFFHPMLDSLGVEAPLREVTVNSARPVRADLGIPSPARLRTAICGPKSTSGSSAFMIGIVRDARNGEPAAGVAVKGEWLEMSFRKNGLSRHIPSLVALTGTNGWFAMCNLPSSGTMALIASRGADSTSVVDVEVPGGGLLRHDLYLGPAGSLSAGATAPVTDTVARGTIARAATADVPTSSTQAASGVAAPLRRLRTGNGKISGIIFAANGADPVPGALVRITDGPGTRANQRGEWTLLQAPEGTRMLEVRAVGYQPQHRSVNVVAGAAPVRVSLASLKTVLDTVKILARRRVFDRDRNGFQARRRSGIGQYISAEEITVRQLVVTSDLFRNMAGVRLETDAGGFEKQILVRGNIAEWCSPAVYLDGKHLRGATANDVDVWVNPEEIAGVEVYAGLGAPMEFKQALTDCGSILIWTK